MDAYVNLVYEFYSSLRITTGARNNFTGLCYGTFVTWQGMQSDSKDTRRIVRKYHDPYVLQDKQHSN